MVSTHTLKKKEGKNHQTLTYLILSQISEFLHQVEIQKSIKLLLVATSCP